ncbi:MAG: phosphate acyltransferase [Candidatus Neomarinimicrobiota bacterium]
MIKNWADIISIARQSRSRTVIVAGAADKAILGALRLAAGQGLIRPVLVDTAEQFKLCRDDPPVADWTLVEVPAATIATEAVRLVREQSGALLMKGRISTAELIKAALNRIDGIRGGKRLSHVAAVETPGYHKLLFITDGGINLHPNAEALTDITANAIELVRRLGIERPRTALVALVETVSPQIRSTITAREVAARFPREIIEGPVSIDIALSRAAAVAKDFTSRIAGETDILVMPNATACNVVVKALRLVGGGRIGGVVLGAQTPILLVSRSDDANSKLRSIALGIAYQNSFDQTE